MLGRKLSPNPPKRNSQIVEKDEGISDEEDTAELKLQLELNEQVRSYNLSIIQLVILILNFIIFSGNSCIAS